ncbi:MAG: hypothetical protein COA79_09140 [Planctomycetota bacterium]|nr:MAG: hypothetical protein COA79_09140 [Planctomycetota bacterium]
MPTSIAPALIEGLRILELAATHEEPLHFEDLCNQLDLSRSSVSRVVKSLVSIGFLKQGIGKRGGYTPGLRMLTMLKSCDNDLILVNNINDILYELCEKLNASIQMSMFDPQRIAVNVLCNAVIETTPFVVGPGDERLTTSCHRHAGAIVLLANLSEENKERLLNKCTWQKKTEKTLHTRAQLEKKLKIVQAKGYCLDEEEYAPLFYRVSIALFNRDKSKLYSLCASWFAAGLKKRRVEEIKSALILAKHELEKLPL